MKKPNKDRLKSMKRGDLLTLVQELHEAMWPDDRWDDEDDEDELVSRVTVVFDGWGLDPGV